MGKLYQKSHDNFCSERENSVRNKINGFIDFPFKIWPLKFWWKSASAPMPIPISRYIPHIRQYNLLACGFMDQYYLMLLSAPNWMILLGIIPVWPPQKGRGEGDEIVNFGQFCRCLRMVLGKRHFFWPCGRPRLPTANLFFPSCIRFSIINCLFNCYCTSNITIFFFFFFFFFFLYF